VKHEGKSFKILIFIRPAASSSLHTTFMHIGIRSRKWRPSGELFRKWLFKPPYHFHVYRYLFYSPKA